MKEDKTLFEDFMDTILQTNLPRQHFRSEAEKIANTRKVLNTKMAEARRMADNDKILKIREQLVALKDREAKLAKKARELRQSKNNNRPRTIGAERVTGRTTRTTGG